MHCKYTGLPIGDNPKALSFPHFPTRQQAFIWRNWGILPLEKLAAVLQTTDENIQQLAKEMGLPSAQITVNWIEKGYMTIIRNNWHLVPYQQLLQLLEWSPSKMDLALKEDDSLWNKLGQVKPDAKKLLFRPLSFEEKRKTEQLKKNIKQHFSDLGNNKYRPFNFKYPLSKTKKNMRSSFNLKLIYSHSAIYGDPLLDSELSSYPDELLKSYSIKGINGIWLQGVLYSLIPWDRAPEMAKDWEKRISNLKRLVKKAKKFGIGVYLYINEPRAIPTKYKDNFNDLLTEKIWNFDSWGLCTSFPEVQNYLKNSMAKLFSNIPELAGVFTITMSENPTNCFSYKQNSKCPRCSKRSAPEVIAEVNRLIAEGIHSVSPDAKVLVGDWAWEDDWSIDTIKRLPTDVELMCISEWGLDTYVEGIKGKVVDYSISKVGPSPQSLKKWKLAQSRGIKTVAKIQINNSWECSAVPYIPAIDLIEEHLNNLRQAGVENLVLSWTLGGWPSSNLELLYKTKEELARDKFGLAAPYILKAWKKFSEAFKIFPFHLTRTIYTAPQNYGPSNLLYEHPTEYKCTMVGFPYDTLEYWRSIYPSEIFEKQFYKLSKKWNGGLEQLNNAKEYLSKSNIEDFRELKSIAEAVYCHFRSTYNQIAFIRRRNNKDRKSIVEILNILDEEIKLACDLYKIILVNPQIGYEASNHYYYTPNNLMEKVLNCLYLKDVYLLKTL